MSPNILHFSAHGKLLLSAEYFVLDGATALALPTRPGQSLEIHEVADDKSNLSWQSLDEKNNLWFEAIYSLPTLDVKLTSDAGLAEKLKSILLAARRQSSGFLMDKHSIEATTRLGFPRSWGLGTSSTLISNIARWSVADPFRLLFDTMGGSGYDIACASADQPILYRIENEIPAFELCGFNPMFREHLYFVYLGQKQDSRQGIARYRKQTERKTWLHEISAITYKMLNAKSLVEFQSLMQQHENLVSETISLPPVQQKFFPDFPGTVKSLGAWGGDFILAASPEPEQALRQYFQQKAMPVFLPYTELIF